MVHDLQYPMPSEICLHEDNHKGEVYPAFLRFLHGMPERLVPLEIKITTE